MRVGRLSNVSLILSRMQVLNYWLQSYTWDKSNILRHCMHCCEVVYKDMLKRLNVTNSISERCQAVSWCEAYWAPQKLLPLRWRSVLGGSSGIVISIFAHKGGQYFEHGLMSMHSHWIMQVARPKSFTLCWGSVEADFYDIVAMTLQALLPRKAADSSVKGQCGRKVIALSKRQG